MDKKTRDQLFRETISNISLMCFESDPERQKRQAATAGVNGGRLLFEAGRTAWRFYRTHPGNPGTHPGPSGTQRK